MPIEAIANDETGITVEGFDGPETVAAEANLLRLPLFALGTKGLKELDGFEFRGTIGSGGITRAFLLRTARNTATAYPGPLSRSAHLAFLAILTERGLPTMNPVTWTWRELCRRLGVSVSGRTVAHLKDAIEATAGLSIYSHDAFYSKATLRLIFSSSLDFGPEACGFAKLTKQDAGRPEATP
ncbi:MAG: hypothetical protein M3552_18010 [Planctomycetota bacterium]|nr:hypothetical protein [Planctomycetaceae bacterium]MDQ3332515.1 hypothetical protein [Planctomycetota bacterium]